MRMSSSRGPERLIVGASSDWSSADPASPPRAPPSAAPDKVAPNSPIPPGSSAPPSADPIAVSASTAISVSADRRCVLRDARESGLLEP
jgi:hypothetical protein